MQCGEFNVIRTMIISLFILCLVFSKGLFATEEKSVKLPEAEKKPETRASLTKEEMDFGNDVVRLGNMKSNRFPGETKSVYDSLVPKEAYDMLRNIKKDFSELTTADAEKAIKDSLFAPLKEIRPGSYKKYYNLASDKRALDPSAIKIREAIDAAFPPDLPNGNNSAVEALTLKFGKKGILEGYDALIYALNIQDQIEPNVDRVHCRELLDRTLTREINRRNQMIEKAMGDEIDGGIAIETALLTDYKEKVLGSKVVDNILGRMAKETSIPVRGGIVDKTAEINSAPRVKMPEIKKVEKTAALPSAATSQTQIAVERDAQIGQVAESLIVLSSKKEAFSPEEIKMVFNAFNYRSKEVANMLFDELSPDVLDGLEKNLPDDLKSQFNSRMRDRSFNAKRVMDELTAAANNKSYIKTPDKLLEIISMSLTTSNFNSDFIQKNLKMLDHECIKAEGINLATFLQETLMKVRRDSSKYPVIQNVVKVLNDL